MERSFQADKAETVSPAMGIPYTHTAPAKSWGNHQPPNQRTAVRINMKLGGWSRRGSRCRSEQYFFSKESTFSKQPTKRCDLLHTTALAKYNLSCLKFSLIVCMRHDFQETKKKKKENTPDFKKICVRAKCISDPVKDKLSPSDST